MSSFTAAESGHRARRVTGSKLDQLNVPHWKSTRCLSIWDPAWQQGAWNARRLSRTSTKRGWFAENFKIFELNLGQILVLSPILKPVT